MWHPASKQSAILIITHNLGRKLHQRERVKTANNQSGLGIFLKFKELTLYLNLVEAYILIRKDLKNQQQQKKELFKMSHKFVLYNAAAVKTRKAGFYQLHKITARTFRKETYFSFDRSKMVH